MVAEKKGPWTVVSKREAYDNRWIRVTHHDVITPGREAGIYGTVHFKNLAIGIVPVDDQGYTYLVGQHRFALDQYSWEIPEGGGDLDVDPKESAARELKEETGLSATSWCQLLQCDLSNSVSDERGIAFLAWDLTQGMASPDPTEQLVLRRLPLTEVFRMVAAGEIQDALSILALQAVELLHLRGRLPVQCI
jgi:8-oxo-dGTP pyrophosphatase MutT (NUDIX family)